MPPIGKTRWSLDPSDVTSGEMSTASGGRRKLRQSRKLDVRGSTVWMEHRPTGVRVEGSIEEGHYSRDEMRKLKEQLRHRLLLELEQEVARHLRVPGFTSKKRDSSATHD